MSYLAIAPYRNPFLLAKSAATTDLLSGGRLILGVGAGYLAGEFAALGVDRSERAALLAETVELLPEIWTGKPVSAEGRHFRADHQISMPHPTQPSVPIWIGGNSKRTRRLVAEHAAGWTPLLVGEEGAVRAGTTKLPDLDQLEASVRELHDLTLQAGRNPTEIEVQVKTPISRIPNRDFDADEHAGQLDALRDAGATWFVVHPLADNPTEASEMIEAYGESVIAQIQAGSRSVN